LGKGKEQVWGKEWGKRLGKKLGMTREQVWGRLSARK
jgi:hypothetical protein